VKLLLDENLSRRLVPSLQESFPGSIHVSIVGMLQTPDADIWVFTKANGFTILTKDDDFLALAQKYGPPPKLVVIEFGNCTNAQLQARLLNAAAKLWQFASSPEIGIIKLV
jgi:predicted nuclease of predicted toxin-antitoxin system